MAKFPAGLRDAGAQALGLDFAASDEDTVYRRPLKKRLNIYGNVDVLVYNAGMSVFGSEELT